MAIGSASFTLRDLIPDPHSVAGSWIIVLFIVAIVILGALALRFFAPIHPTPLETSAGENSNTQLASKEA